MSGRKTIAFYGAEQRDQRLTSVSEALTVLFLGDCELTKKAGLANFEYEIRYNASGADGWDWETTPSVFRELEQMCFINEDSGNSETREWHYKLSLEGRQVAFCMQQTPQEVAVDKAAKQAAKDRDSRSVVQIDFLERFFKENLPKYPRTKDIAADVKNLLIDLLPVIDEAFNGSTIEYTAHRPPSKVSAPLPFRSKLRG